jgi:hypothetical protein
MVNFRVYNHKSARGIQHQQFRFSDPGRPHPQRRIIYTGELSIGHGAEDDQTYVYFQYLILSHFGPAVEKGIIPYNPPAYNQLRSAVSATFLSFIKVKDTGSSGGFTPNALDEPPPKNCARVDLFKIVLDQPRNTIFALVLHGNVVCKEFELTTISYHISVVEEDTKNPPFLPPIVIGPSWNGEYDLTNAGEVGLRVQDGFPQKF